MSVFWMQYFKELFLFDYKNFKWHFGGCLTYTSAEQSSAVKHPPKQTHFNSDKKVNSKPSGSGRSPLNRFANRPVKPQSAFFEFCSFLITEFFSFRIVSGGVFSRRFFVSSHHKLLLFCHTGVLVSVTSKWYFYIAFSATFTLSKLAIRNREKVKKFF